MGKPSAKREGLRERSDCRLVPENMGSKEEPSPEYIIVTYTEIESEGSERNEKGII